MRNYSDAPLQQTQPQCTHDDTDTLRRFLTDSLETWLPRLLPGGVARHGAFNVGSTAGEKGKSLCVSLTGERRGLWVDHATSDGGDAFALLQSCLGTDFKGAVKVAREMMGGVAYQTQAAPSRPLRDIAADLTRQKARRDSIGLILQRSLGTNDLVERYLRGRGITIAPPASLRSHYWLAHPYKSDFYPAMVAPVLALSGDLIGIHRTYLHFTEDDAVTKHPTLDPVRAMLGESKGGAVHLSPPSDSIELAVCEGIETGLSVLELGLWQGPMWACLSTSGLRSIDLPCHVSRLVIFADWDKPMTQGAHKGLRPGTMAAEALAARARERGLRCEVRYPATSGDAAVDYNDVLLNQKGM